MKIEAFEPYNQNQRLYEYKQLHSKLDSDLNPDEYPKNVHLEEGICLYLYIYAHIFFMSNTYIYLSGSGPTLDAFKNLLKLILLLTSWHFITLFKFCPIFIVPHYIKVDKTSRTYSTVCPISSNPFYVVGNCIKLGYYFLDRQ